MLPEVKPYALSIHQQKLESLKRMILSLMHIKFLMEQRKRRCLCKCKSSAKIENKFPPTMLIHGFSDCSRFPTRLIL